MGVLRFNLGAGTTRWLLGAIVIGALVRMPGVAWGANWPDGFGLHHPDEITHVASANVITSPLTESPQQEYPKALAAYAAVPFLVWYAAHGQFGGPRIRVPWIVGTGRLISVAFGVVAIWIVFAVGRDVLRDRRAGAAAAWLLALGGLHVTQSHFFVADVPAVTWTLLATWLLWRDLRESRADDHEALRWAAFAAGAAFAFKLFVFVVPALVYATLSRRPRGLRAAHAAVFLGAGTTLSSLGYDSPLTFYRAMTEGINVAMEFDRVRSGVMYLVQLPAIFSLPLLVVAGLGGWDLLRRVLGAGRVVRRHALLVFGLAPMAALAAILFRLDHFPRHWIILTPWAALAGGWYLSRLIDRFEARGRSPAVVLAPLFLWMAIFVVDGERLFMLDPRNEAARWLRAHVPPESSVYWTWHRTPTGYRPGRWPGAGEPDVLVIEMFEANNYLSGINWRDTYPTDPRQVFDGRTADRVAEMQALFRGPSPYVEVARFPDTYVMPEYRLASRLLGDRARNYITEVVIFRRREPAPDAGDPGSDAP